MTRKWLRIFVPFFVIIAGAIVAFAIIANAPEQEIARSLETRANVTVKTLVPQSFQTKIKGFGEVKPAQITELSAQVSGKVIAMDDTFVLGGIVQRDTPLLDIDDISYKAALSQAKAQALDAKSQLIEEQARAEVALRESKNLPKNRVTDLYLRKPQVLSAQAGLASAEANVALAEYDLANTTVLAPFNALITERAIGVGQVVGNGSTIAQLFSIETAEIHVAIANFDLNFVQPDVVGQTALVIPRSKQSSPRSGTIKRDLGRYNQDTRMLELIIEVKAPYKPGAILKFGAFVDVEFDGILLENVYRVPQSLVNRGKVWLVDENDRLRKRDVSIIRDEGTYLFVNEGLNPGERLLMTIPEYPTEGMEVRVSQIDDSFVNNADTINP